MSFWKICALKTLSECNKMQQIPNTTQKDTERVKERKKLRPSVIEFTQIMSTSIRRIPIFPCNFPSLLRVDDSLKSSN